MPVAQPKLEFRAISRYRISDVTPGHIKIPDFGCYASMIKYKIFSKFIKQISN
jgi:hypothetical protein